MHMDRVSSHIYFPVLDPGKAQYTNAASSEQGLEQLMNTILLHISLSCEVTAGDMISFIVL